MGTRTDRTGRTHQLRAFWFDAAVCRACPLKERCVGSGKGSGRTVRLHPQEAITSVGSCVAEERRVCRVSSAASGGGAQVSASGTAWSEAGAVLRTYQDAVPAVDGSDGGQSDTGGWQSWEDGRNLRRNHLWARRLLSCRHLHSTVERHSGLAEWVVDPDYLDFTTLIAPRQRGFRPHF